MDLQKPKKSRPETRNDQDDSSEYRVNGYKPSAAIDNDENGPRQDRGHEVGGGGAAATIDTNQKKSNASKLKLQPQTVPPRVIKFPVRSRPSPQILAARIPKCISLDTQQIHKLRYADMMPPVTKDTLSELDLDRIVQNIHLRMDANYESELHFMPDNDGEKGRQKKMVADDYWEAMSLEIMIYTYTNLHRSQAGEIETARVPDIRTMVKDDRLFQPRLPAMFETLHGIIVTLVPVRDHPSVSQNLDVALLMQQVHKGVLDLVSLSDWLACLLKTHCAPMRDPLVDEMAAEIGSGSTHADVDRLISGLRKLFNVLEMMKLDVANHQLGAFRIVLIEGTIPFLQDYFSKRIVSNESRVEKARLWYQGVQQRVTQPTKECTNRSLLPFSVFIQGLCERLLCQDDLVIFPETFEIDLRRLWSLRLQLQRIIDVYVCWSILATLVERHCPKRSYTADSSFSKRISDLIGAEGETSKTGDPGLGTNLANDSCVAMEIARTISVALGRGDDVADDILQQVEDAVKKAFAKTHTSMQMKRVRDGVHQQLLHATWELAQQYVSMSPLEICESQRKQAYAPSADPNMSYIATKLAHIGVLHWRVWAPLVYMANTGA